MINNYDYKQIGERIKQERKDSHKSQEALGELLGVTRQTIAKWENGKEMPQLGDCLNLCNLFGCDLGYLTCEYDCKTRVATDIQAETGLSEKTINYLQSYAEYGMDVQLSFIDHALTSERLSFADHAKKYFDTVTEKLSYLHFASNQVAAMLAGNTFSQEEITSFYEHLEATEKEITLALFNAVEQYKGLLASFVSPTVEAIKQAESEYYKLVHSLLKRNA